MKKHIFLIEDDTFITQMYSSKFSSMGFEITIAKDPMIAEKLLFKDNQKTDIILLDIILPGKDGFELLKEIKKNDHTKDIPVIILSNLSTQKDINQAITLGAVDYIIKSNFTPNEVVDTIKKYI